MKIPVVCFPLLVALLAGCSDDRPTTSANPAEPVEYTFDPAAYPQEAPEIEPESGYESLAALIESRNATPERVRAMLKDGAYVNEVGKRGWTPLHWAAAYNRDPQVTSLLLDAGADVDAVGNRLTVTPLHCAAMTNPNPKVMQVLLEAGAEVDARLEGGDTPLWMACASSQKNPEIILVLLNAGADANIENISRETPLDFAKKNEALKGTKALEALKSATSKWSLF